MQSAKCEVQTKAVGELPACAERSEVNVLPGNSRLSTERSDSMCGSAVSSGFTGEACQKKRIKATGFCAKSYGLPQKD